MDYEDDEKPTKYGYKPLSDEQVLERAREDFERCAEAEEDNRQCGLDDLKFAKLGEQWPEEVQRARERDGRPCLTLNRLPTFIRQVVNDSRMNRPAIRVQPVDSGADPETAEVLNGLIRNIEVQSKAGIAYDTAIDSSVSSGIGYFRVSTDYSCDDTFDMDIKIDRIVNRFTVYGDYESTAADSSDWNRAFVTEMITKEEKLSRWPDSEQGDTQGWSVGENDTRDHMWYTDNMIRIAEYWTREKYQRQVLQMSNGSIMFDDEYADNAEILQASGIIPVNARDVMSYKVMQYIVTGDEVLERNEWQGRYIPIIPVYGDEINVEGKRYFLSLIHYAKDAQQSYNYWRTSAVEKVALDTKAPWIGPVGSFANDADKWATANNTNHPYIEYTPVPGQPGPSRQFGGGVPAGDLQMAMSASDDMKSIMGIYDASLGARGNETSGVAIRARQMEGDVSTFHFIDNLSRAIQHCGCILVDLIPKVYNSARMIRVLGEDGQPAPALPGQPPGMVPINQPVEINGIERTFDLTTGKYDVVVNTGPSFTTRREESAAQMMEMIKGNPSLAPLIGDLIATNQDWPGADEIAKRLRAMLPPQLQGENPETMQLKQQIQQGQAQLQEMQQQLKSMQSAVKDKQAENMIQARSLEIDAMNAETNRIKVMLDAQLKQESQEIDKMTQLIQPLMQRIDEIGQAINGLMQQPLQNTPYGDDNQGAV
jgi:hypothetical protein